MLRIVEEQKCIITKQQQRIIELESEYELLSGEVDGLRMTTNDLEQYGRRNNLRISNMISGPRALRKVISRSQL